MRDRLHIDVQKTTSMLILKKTSKFGTASPESCGFVVIDNV